jgi:mannosylglycoprotein endo-beta-mannosidase
MWKEGEKVTEADNDEITKPFSEEEIKEAFFQMETNKLAGPDNIPIELYQKCWEIIKEDIIELFDDFHKGVLDVSKITYGIITLLPKVINAEKNSAIQAHLFTKLLV